MAPEKAQEEAQVEALIALKTAFLNNRTQNDGRKHRRVGLGPICFGAAKKLCRCSERRYPPQKHRVMVFQLVCYPSHLG